MRLEKCRVLIIEDEWYIARDLEATLTDFGATVIGPIAEFSEAMARVQRNGFDVAMLDINLRSEATYSVADELLRQHIPFGFTTGYSRDAIPDRFRDVTFWEKPYVTQQIVDDLARLCNPCKNGN